MDDQFWSWKYLSNSKPTWISHFHQVDECLKTNPDSILEIGVGTGLFGSVIKHFTNVVYESLDITPELKPTYIASVLNLPFSDNSFDTICCFQVLEHLPFEDFETALRQIFRCAKNAVVLSLPNAGRVIKIKLPKIKFNIELFGLRQNIYSGHMWEINYKGSPKKIVEKKIYNIVPVGWELKKSYRVDENPYHHFYVFSKIKSE